VIGAHSIAALRIAPDTSYRRALRYFARAGQRGSSAFPHGLCRLRLKKVGLSKTVIAQGREAATPVKCTFFGD